MPLIAVEKGSGSEETIFKQKFNKVQLKYFVFRLGGAMIFNNETALEFRFQNVSHLYIGIKSSFADREQ